MRADDLFTLTEEDNPTRAGVSNVGRIVVVETASFMAVMMKAQYRKDELSDEKFYDD